MNDERWVALIDDLRRLPAETEWVEFKVNNSDPQRMGRTISALSNVACIWGQQFAYMVWGIADETHDVVGTTFEPKREKVGAEALELWLAKALSPSPAFKFITIGHPAGSVVLLEIPAANSVPVKFNSVAYIRVGSTTPKLAVHTANELDSCGQNEWAPRATLGMFLAVVNGRQSYSTKLSRPFAGSNRSQKKSWR